MEKVSTDLLDELEAYLEKRVDILDGESGPLPNDAMRLLMRLQEERHAQSL